MKARKKFRIPLYLQMISAIILGLTFGAISVYMGWADPVRDFIRPFGTIFLHILKLTAIPLVLTSLITGIAALRSPKYLGRIAGRTVLLYVGTTVIAVSLGLALGNTIRPGDGFSEEARQVLREKYAREASLKAENIEVYQEKGPLQFLVDMVPENLGIAISDNRYMLQVILFALLVGLAIAVLPKETGRPAFAFFRSFNEVILKLVDFIMLMAPIGIFALIATAVTEIAGEDPAQTGELLIGLLRYMLTVLIGLLLMLFLVYPLMLLLLAKKFNPLRFYKSILPAQLLAFTTGSSTATLPLTMERAEQHLGLNRQISGFALPLGTTIHLDGTSLCQAVAALFITQVFQYDLSFTDQLMIMLTATLASIGSATVPGAGMVMLIVVLNAAGVSGEGIVLIMLTDRILEMLRTAVNVTGDLCVATVVATHEKKYHVVDEITSWENEQP